MSWSKIYFEKYSRSLITKKVDTQSANIKKIKFAPFSDKNGNTIRYMDAAPKTE